MEWDEVVTALTELVTGKTHINKQNLLENRAMLFLFISETANIDPVNPFDTL